MTLMNSQKQSYRMSHITLKGRFKQRNQIANSEKIQSGTLKMYCLTLFFTGFICRNSVYFIVENTNLVTQGQISMAKKKGYFSI